MASTSPTSRPKRPVNKRTLVQQMEEEDAQQKPKQARKARRNLDGVVDKLIKDNFRGWGCQQVDCVTRQGLTLRQTLLRDKEQHAKNEITMGKNYYAMMRKLFEDVESPTKRLRVTHRTDPENETLKSALYELMGHRTNSKAFLSFLDQDVVDNQRTVVAVLKAALDIKPDCGPKQCNLVLDVMRWCLRNSVNLNYKAEVQIVKDHFDAALTKSYSFAKKNDIGIDSWWSVNSDIAAIIMDTTDFEKCLQCQSQWLDVADSLKTVVSESLLGQTLFGPALRSLKHNRAQTTIDKLLEELMKETTITAQVVKQLKNKFVLESKKDDHDPYETFQRKVVQVKYRGFQCDVSVNTLMEHWSLSSLACIKGVAVRAKILSPLFMEDDLALDSGAKDPALSKEVVKQAIEARKVAAKLLDAADEVTGEAIMKALTSKRLALVSLDPSFKVEEAFWAHLRGDGGLAIVHTRILKCLPDKDTEKTIAQSLQELDNLGKSGVCNLCGLGIAGQMQTVQGWISAMKNGRSPGFGKACTGTFLESVRNRCGHFAVAPQGAAGSDDPPVSSGKAAIDHIFADLVKKSEGEGATELTLADLRPLHIFDFLLDAEQVKTSAELTQKVVDRVGGVGSTSAEHASEGAAFKKRKPAKGKDPRAALVDGYFETS